MTYSNDDNSFIIRAVNDLEKPMESTRRIDRLQYMDVFENIGNRNLNSNYETDGLGLDSVLSHTESAVNSVLNSVDDCDSNWLSASFHHAPP